MRGAAVGAYVCVHAVSVCMYVALLGIMLNPDPEKRATITDIIHHPWYNMKAADGQATQASSYQPSNSDVADAITWIDEQKSRVANNPNPSSSSSSAFSEAKSSPIIAAGTPVQPAPSDLSLPPTQEEALQLDDDEENIVGPVSSVITHVYIPPPYVMRSISLCIYMYVAVCIG